MIFFRFVVLAFIKVFSKLFYRIDFDWIGRPIVSWGDLRLIMLLNHTSLFEPLFAGMLPWKVLWRVARSGVFPVAAETMERPITGKFFSLMAHRVISLTRKRDGSWSLFMANVDRDSIVLITPEGRMKRPGGLDKTGKPMTVRAGVVEVLKALGSGPMLIAYSGGLHHIQTPGQRLPRVFKTLRLRLECLEIDTYLSGFERLSDSTFRKAVVADLEGRRDRNSGDR